MSLYSHYLFVKEPKSVDSRGAGNGLTAASAPFMLQCDLVDLCEMYMRRRMIAWLARKAVDSQSNRTDLTVSSMRDGWALRRDVCRYAGGIDSSDPTIKSASPSVMLNPGRFDAGDNTDGTSYYSVHDAFDIPSHLWHYYEDSTGDVTLRSVLSEMTSTFLYDFIGEYGFLDPDWEPDMTWGANAEGTDSFDRDHSGTLIGGINTSTTRYKIPDGAFFHSIADAVYARPLRGPVDYTYTDESGTQHTVSIKVPPYVAWYDPEGSSIHHTPSTSDASFRTWGKFCGASRFSLHTTGAFLFPYDKNYSSDSTTGESVYNTRYGSDYRTQYIAKPTDNALLASGGNAIPDLQTSASWWEDAGLGVSKAASLLPAGPCRNAMQSFYISPAVAPMLLTFSRYSFPPDQDWSPEESSASYNSSYSNGYLSYFPFKGSILHAEEFLGKLHKIVIPVKRARVEFNCSVDSEYKHYEYGESGTASSKTITEKTHHTIYSSWASGWCECKTDGTTQLDPATFGNNGSAFYGFALSSQRPNGSDAGSAQSSYKFVNELGGSSTFVTGYHIHSVEGTSPYASSGKPTFTVSSITPVAVPSNSGMIAYDYMYAGDYYRYTQNGQNASRNPGVITDAYGTPPPYSGTRVHGNADRAVDPLIPDWAMPFVSSAELIMVCEGELITYPSENGEGTGDRSYDPRYDPGDWTHSVVYSCSRTVKRVRRVVSLGTISGASTLKFDNLSLDLNALLDSIITADSGTTSNPWAMGGDTASAVPPQNTRYLYSGDAVQTYSDFHADYMSWGVEYPYHQEYKVENSKEAVRERKLTNVSLFLVLDTNPDADVVPAWAQNAAS